jgi:hypothetical protein
MGNIEEIFIRAIEEANERRRNELRGEFADAAPEDREAILAESEYCDWLGECCSESLRQA